MTRLRPCGLLTPVCLFSLLAACGDEPATTDTTTDTTSTGSATGTTSTATDDTPTSGDSTSTSDPTSSPTSSSSSSSSSPSSSSSSSSDTDDTGGPALEIAHGIRLTRVTATQGVQTDIVRNGIELDAAEYAVALISRRKTVLRADWSLHATFTPRPLIGRLTVWTPEGDVIVDTSEILVDGPSNDGDLFKTFAWQLPADLVRPGMEYRIEAFEADPALATGDISDPPPVLPLAGRGKLIVEDNPMVLKVELIPVKHVINGMTCLPTVTDADVAAMRQGLEQHNAVERAELVVGPPMEYTESIGESQEGFVPILNALGMHRAKLKPAPNVYYYGLLTSCDSYPPGLGGQAIAITEGSGMEFAYQRIATGRYNDSGLGARDTFVHEIGHAQGRYHIRCSGSEAGTDDDYPYSNGRIGKWGYGIHDTVLRSPTGVRDYMTYCGPSFVSDFGWQLTYGFIKELSSWDAEGPPATPQPPVLHGTMTPGGTPTWWTSHGAVPQRGRAHETLVEFDTGSQTITLPASVTEIPDSQSLAIAVALPPQWSEVKKLRLRVAGKPLATTPRTAVTVLHAAP